MRSPPNFLLTALTLVTPILAASWSAGSYTNSSIPATPAVGMSMSGNDSSSTVGGSTANTLSFSSASSTNVGASSGTPSPSMVTTSVTSSAPAGMYTNPILNAVGAADPWVTTTTPFDGYYYMTFSLNTNITLYRSKSLTDWNNADQKLLWLPPTGQAYSTDIWAPEIHFLDGLWYVIFTADPNFDTPPPQVSMYCTFDCPAFYHRMYTLESSSSDIWNANYSLKSELDTFNQFAIDGTYFQYNSSLYHVYSCWFTTYESWPSNLCIDKLSNPYTVATNFTQRTIISVPTQPWEQTPYGHGILGDPRLASNEGPEQLTSPVTGQQFIIYSAARSDNPNYCLGLLALKQYDGADPMNAQDWVKEDGCVLYQDKPNQAYGVGHASFVQSPDGSEWYVVYHGMQDPFSGWSARNIRAQKFTWDPVTGYPVFPRPGYGPYPLPSGQTVD